MACRKLLLFGVEHIVRRAMYESIITWIFATPANSNVVHCGPTGTNDTKVFLKEHITSKPSNHFMSLAHQCITLYLRTDISKSLNRRLPHLSINKRSEIDDS